MYKIQKFVQSRIFINSEFGLFSWLKTLQVVSIANSPHFKRFNATILPLPFPNCESLSFNTDEYWTCVLRLAATTLGHQVGTCKMGPREDPTTVVDPELKVHGVGNLRVVDGSIMPHVVAGHTNAAIYMIGEKASDMIKERWRNSWSVFSP